jgi:hypothetical protein
VLRLVLFSLDDFKSLRIHNHYPFG